MDDKNMWDWNDGDERMVSSVYKEETDNAFILINEPQNIAPQSTESQAMDLQNIDAAEMADAQNIDTAEMADAQNIDTTEITDSKNTTSRSTEPMDLQNTIPQIVEESRNTDLHSGEPVDPQNTDQKPNVQSNPAQNGNPQPKPQNNIWQPEFQPVVLSQRNFQNYEQKRQSASNSAQFNPKDISENKVSAMAAYLLGPIGIIIALLIARDSAYTAFHVRQALKMTISSVVLEIFAGVFALFGMIPLVGIIFWLMVIIAGVAWFGILVLRIIAIAQVSDGEAKEPAIIGNFHCFK